jgi:hypothetical protein
MALTFIQNGGIFNNHFYKKREPAGVTTDPAARGDMKRWMMLASRANHLQLQRTSWASFMQSIILILKKEQLRFGYS